MKRKVYRKAKIAKCDFCKTVKKLEFKYIRYLDQQEEIIVGELEVCKDCASVLDEVLHIENVQEEIELSRKVLF